MNLNQNNSNSTTKLRINHFIRVSQVRVILEDGSQAGVMTTREALKMAQDLGMDLIEINPKTSPVIVKIMDYGKFKYEEKKQAAESRKNQRGQELKELTFRPNTDENDLNHKLAQAKSFLDENHKVKFTIRFRGREISHPHVGREKLEWILKQLEGSIAANPMISLEGKFMMMVVSPIKKS